MGTRRQGRIVAIQGLYAWEEGKNSIEELMQMEWLDEKLSDKVKAFAGMLIAGTLENKDEIDEHIKAHLKHWSFDRLAKVDLSILRSSVYAMIYQPDIPISVTIDEAVEIAKQFGSPESYRFVNGVLDSIRGTILS